MCNIDRGLICFYGKCACFNGFTWSYEFKECLNSNLLLKLLCYTMVQKSNEYKRNKNVFTNKKNVDENKAGVKIVTFYGLIMILWYLSFKLF